MKSAQAIKKAALVFGSLVFCILVAGCDYFFQDPRLILYRPAVIRIEGEGGELFQRLPLPLQPPGQGSNRSGAPVSIPEYDALWNKNPEESGLSELFSSQEVPYLGGDNCLNSAFFDLIGIPYSKEGDLSYHSKEFYRNLQGYVKEPANYFFYNNRLFLKESTYPYINKEQVIQIGTEKVKGGADRLLDQFYQDRLTEYRKRFAGQVKVYQIRCEYPPQPMGRIREDVQLNLMESADSLLFLADKRFHMIMRKDDTLRYVSEFAFSKAFFRQQLQFKEN